MSTIRFDHVSKRFTLHRERPRSFQELFLNLFHFKGFSTTEEYWALRDVSLQVDAGQTVGIVGPNGAGKSTMLKLITRIIGPTSGQIEIGGRVGALLELGAGFHPDLTGRENIYLNGSILGFSRSKMKQILNEIVDFSEMEKFIDVPVKHYSSGMYMRLAFSIAIHIEPDILLVDEVLAVGDQAFQHRCLDKINELKRQGVTIVLVTHNLDMVRTLCDRAVWLDEGQVQVDGSVSRVLEQYLAYVQVIDGQALQEAEAIRRGDEKTSKSTSHASQGSGIQNAESTWRWGSREAEFVHIELLNNRGQETRTFKTGESFTARMHYLAHRRIDNPLFGIALHHVSGFHINGPNTGFADYPIDFIEGQGHLDYIIPSLPLLAGTYLLSAALYNSDGKYAFDHHHMAYTFRVDPSPDTSERYGFFCIPSRWRLEPQANGDCDERDQEGPDP
jgi:ABC-type polysaccharide/polyol phosphate transport system ATPase subunit